MREREGDRKEERIREREKERERRSCIFFVVFVPRHGPPAWSLVVWATAVH